MVILFLIMGAVSNIAFGLPTEMESVNIQLLPDIASPNDIQQNSTKCDVPEAPYKLVRRSEWRARKPVQILPLKMPVPYVVIHHTFIPPACYDQSQCSYAMRTIQSMHVDDKSRGWWDIGYNFGVGSDGSVYEGRGWTVLGAHALRFNNVSLGICLIGNWMETIPPEAQLQTTKALIADGVAKGYISPDYKLVGHRQVRPTECPGQALYEHISQWPHFDPSLNLAAGFKDSLDNVALRTDKIVSTNKNHL